MWGQRQKAKVPKVEWERRDERETERLIALSSSAVVCVCVSCLSCLFIDSFTCIRASGACWHRHSIYKSICCSYYCSSTPEESEKIDADNIKTLYIQRVGIVVLVCRLPLSAARVSRRPALLLLLLEFYILTRKFSCRRNDDARDHGRRLVNVSDQIDTSSRATAGSVYSAHFLYISPPKTLTTPYTTLCNCSVSAAGALHVTRRKIEATLFLLLLPRWPWSFNTLVYGSMRYTHFGVCVFGLYLVLYTVQQWIASLKNGELVLLLLLASSQPPFRVKKGVWKWMGTIFRTEEDGGRKIKRGRERTTTRRKEKETSYITWWKPLAVV